MSLSTLPAIGERHLNTHGETFSILICAHDEATDIGHLLNELVVRAVRLTGFQEIVVVDDGSSDATPEIIEEMVSRCEGIRLVRNESRMGKTSSLNRGLSFCRGALIVMLDADVLPEEGSIEKLLDVMADQRIGAACGRPIPINLDSSFFGRASQILWDIQYDVMKEESRAHRFSVLTGCFYVLRSNLISRFPQDVINEDALVGWTVRKRGYDVSFVGGAPVYLNAPMRMSDYCEQRKRVIRGNLQSVIGNGVQMKPQIGVVEFFFGQRRYTNDPDAEKSVSLKLSLVLKRIAKRPSDLFGLSILGILELYSQMSARLDLRLGFVNNKWPQIATTKGLRSLEVKSHK